MSYSLANDFLYQKSGARNQLIYLENVLPSEKWVGTCFRCQNVSQDGIMFYTACSATVLYAQIVHQ